jgi:hypothetical protein
MRSGLSRFEEPALLADAIIGRVGKTLVVGLPTGLGKANHVINALFMRAAADPSITLHIITGLTLEKPRAKRGIESRFLSPFVDRVFNGYPMSKFTSFSC